MKKSIRPRRPLTAGELEQRRAAARAPRGPLTDAQLAANRANAQKSTGPVTAEGKARSSRNAWKTGLHSAVHRVHFDNGMQSLIGAMGKPCLTTCPKYPCSLVEDELTSAGGSCLDKQVFVQAFGSIIDAVENGSMGGMHGLMASELAAALQQLHDLRATMADQGLVIGIPMIGEDGEVITRKDGSEVIGKYVANPGYPMMIKTLEVLGISLPELLVTPQAKARAKVEEEKADSMQTVLAGIFQRAAAAKGAPRPAISQDGD
ncbi:hypothetical protein [Pseudoxanthomonas sp. USHLN014]|uniref:hypothetical protein n=1 Tax=Pseudoxanthomonas sp. USHLN014 TaxID=3081297 RepID=UPI00301E0CD4